MKNPDSVAAMHKAAKLISHAEACAERREWQAADELFTRAIAIDTTPASRIAHGVCLANREQYNQAISAFMPILDGTDTLAIGIVCHNLAAIYRGVGDFDLARRFQWRATLLQDDSTSEDLLGLANDAIMSDHPEVAESLVMAAYEMNADVDGENADGDLIATVGLINAKMNAPREGMVALFAAYRRHQAAADFRGMGIDLLNMAMLFSETNRERAERSCLRRAIRCFERASAPFSCQRARHQLEQLDRMQSVRSFDACRN